MNVVLQTAWRIHVKSEKKDLFTDFGPLSRLIIGILALLFEVVEISYSMDEVVKIVKKHFELVVLGVIAVSLLPLVFEVLKARRAAT